MSNPGSNDAKRFRYYQCLHSANQAKFVGEVVFADREGNEYICSEVRGRNIPPTAFHKVLYEGEVTYVRRHSTGSRQLRLPEDYISEWEDKPADDVPRKDGPMDGFENLICLYSKKQAQRFGEVVYADRSGNEYVCSQVKSRNVDTLYSGNCKVLYEGEVRYIRRHSKGNWTPFPRTQARSYGPVPEPIPVPAIHWFPYGKT